MGRYVNSFGRVTRHSEQARGRIATGHPRNGKGFLLGNAGHGICITGHSQLSLIGERNRATVPLYFVLIMQSDVSSNPFFQEPNCDPARSSRGAAGEGGRSSVGGGAGRAGNRLTKTQGASHGDSRTRRRSLPRRPSCQGTEKLGLIALDTSAFIYQLEANPR
jgi:hypothetical protein